MIPIKNVFYMLAYAFRALDRKAYRPLEEALQKPLFPSRIEQNCSVRFFFTTSKNGVFLPLK